MNRHEFLFTIKRSHSKSYKYLNYVPKPIHLDPTDYDLVDDEEFCIPDGRVPLLNLTQFGIFPHPTAFGKKDYRRLEGLEGQRVGFLGRGYLSNRERRMVMEVVLNENTLELIRKMPFNIASGWLFAVAFSVYFISDSPVAYN